MRYLIYVRFSPRRDAKKCVSCDVQLVDAREWILKINPSAEILEFRDDDSSGKNMNRDGLQACLTSMKRGDLLVVRDWERLARNLYVQLKIARLAEKKNCDMHAIYGGPWRNMNDPAVRLLSNMLASVAEYQREVTSLKTSEKMLRHQAEGRCMGSVPPFGYRIKGRPGQDAEGNPKTVDKRLIPIPEEQVTIKRIIELRDAKGCNWAQLARAIGNEGHKINGQKLWDRSTVRNIYNREKPKQSAVA
jgi:DNA invertase Pin-like site-specific DNA recombinase